jgi:hypothetical protein
MLLFPFGDSGLGMEPETTLGGEVKLPCSHTSRIKYKTKF